MSSDPIAQSGAGALPRAVEGRPRPHTAKVFNPHANSSQESVTGRIIVPHRFSRTSGRAREPQATIAHPCARSAGNPESFLIVFLVALRHRRFCPGSRLFLVVFSGAAVRRVGLKPTSPIPAHAAQGEAENRPACTADSSVLCACRTGIVPRCFLSARFGRASVPRCRQASIPIRPPEKGYATAFSPSHIPFPVFFSPPPHSGEGLGVGEATLKGYNPCTSRSRIKRAPRRQR
jgi:hypothetical protein